MWSSTWQLLQMRWGNTECGFGGGEDMNNQTESYFKHRTLRVLRRLNRDSSWLQSLWYVMTLFLGTSQVLILKSVNHQGDRTSPAKVGRHCTRLQPLHSWNHHTVMHKKKDKLSGEATTLHSGSFHPAVYVPLWTLCLHALNRRPTETNVLLLFTQQRSFGRQTFCSSEIPNWEAFGMEYVHILVDQKTPRSESATR